MHPYVNTAVKAARTAGNIITRAYGRSDRLQITKKGEHDFVTDIDKAAEETIIDILHSAYPTHGFLAEESGETQKSEYVWIIDPIDGTTNFIHGFPHFAISIGLKHKNHIEHAVVYDPIKEDLFTATRGQGAQKNNRRIRVSKLQNFDDALLATGFPFRAIQYHDKYHDTLKEIAKNCVGIRRIGCASLDLAYVASGQLDGFFELDLSPWDIAAGILLVKEAGGFVTDFQGGENYFETGHIVTANPKIIKPLLKQLKPLADLTK